MTYFHTAHIQIQIKILNYKQSMKQCDEKVNIKKGVLIVIGKSTNNILDEQ